MRVVFAVHDFTCANLLLQPWLTIHQVAQGLRQRGHMVHIVTDTPTPARIPGIDAHSRATRPPIGDRWGLIGLLATLRPDALVGLPTPLSLVSRAWPASQGVRRIALASYPFYTGRELWRGVRSVGWRAGRKYVRHAAIPSRVWVRGCRRAFHAVITQSQATCDRLQRVDCRLRVEFIPPGIELAAWPESPVDPSPSEWVELLYLGAASAVRGFEVLLRAMARVKDTRTRLKVLARGADPGQVDQIRRRCEQLGIEANVSVCGGWRSRTDIVRAIHAASAVVLPFVLVPSELPVTVMEVIACGTPVIASRIDGLPSAIGPAGTVVRPGSDADLARVIRDAHSRPELLSAWRAGCVEQRKRMAAWETVVLRWEGMLRG